jgi:hypothetical protein
MPAPATVDLDEPALDLPEPDAKGRDEEVGTTELDDDALEVDESADRDDARADDLDIGDFDTDNRDEGARDEGGPTLDTGDVATFDDRSEDRDGDEAAGDLVATDGIDEPLPGTADDGGVEGTEDGTEADLEGALPALDEGGDEELAMDELLAEVGLGDDTWEVDEDLGVEGALAAVACDDGRIAAVGSILALMERGERTARVRALPEAGRAVAIAPFGVVRSGATGIAVRSGSTDTTPWLRADVSRLGVVGGRLFALASGELARIDDGGFVEVVRRQVLDFATSAGSLVVIEVVDGERVLSCMRGHDGGWEALGSAGALGDIVAAGGRLVVNGARVMAAVGADRVALRWLGASSVRTWALDGASDAAFRGDDRDADLLVLANDTRGATLFGVGVSGPIALTPLGVPTARALVWDGTREIALVAGPHGLRAAGPRVRH